MGARVDEIAAKAKINKGMIYQYFGNKEELYKQFLKMFTTGWETVKIWSYVIRRTVYLR